MTRFSRKKRDDILIKGKGTIFDALDDAIKGIWRINDDEYDYICEQEKEIIDALLYPIDNEDITISGLKNSIKIINKVIQKYYLTNL